MTTLILAALTAFFVVLFSTPSLIKVSRLKHLVDEPGDNRKLHHKSIPTLGGIIIFASILFSYALWFPSQYTGGNEQELVKAFDEFKFIVASVFILFFIGVKDDIIGTEAMKKLVGHLIVSFILVFMAEFQINGMHGLFGINEIPEWGEICLSLFTYMVIVNAYNLIDGVDGLATGISAINAFMFGLWFFYTKDASLATLSFCLGGTMLGFLIFNFSPAKIFMGDSGSLTVGLVFSVLAIRLIEHDNGELNPIINSIPKPLFVMGVLSYPLIDTFRVFFLRAIKGNSPFDADKNHIHHKLLKIGFNHNQTSLAIYTYNFLIVALVLLLGNKMSFTSGFIVIGGIAFLIALIPFLFKSKVEINGNETLK